LEPQQKVLQELFNVESPAAPKKKTAPRRKVKAD